MKNISVIIPVYNAEKWIDRLWNSLKNQTVFSKLEIIFVNDGSTDNSRNILEKIAEEYKNVVIVNKKNAGVSAARNTGIDNATNEYISFIDADDYIDDDYFESYQNILDKDFDMIESGYITEYDIGKMYKKSVNYVEVNNRSEMFKLFALGKIDPNCWNKLYKKEILKQVRFDEQLTCGEDKELIFNYLKYANRIYGNSVEKYHYYIHSASAMRKKFNKKEINVIDRMEQRLEYIKENYADVANDLESSIIDTKCRILCDLIEFKEKDKYKDEYNKMKKSINKYSFYKKYKYSTKKHFLAFVAIRINPKLYLFLKKNMKLQYM